MRLFFFSGFLPYVASSPYLPTAARRLTFTSRYCSLDNSPLSFTPHEVGLENRLFDRMRALYSITSFSLTRTTTYLVKASLVHKVRPFGNLEETLQWEVLFSLLTS